jgi:hypothetical protein
MRRWPSKMPSGNMPLFSMSSVNQPVLWAFRHAELVWQPGGHRAERDRRRTYGDEAGGVANTSSVTFSSAGQRLNTIYLSTATHLL